MVKDSTCLILLLWSFLSDFFVTTAFLQPHSTTASSSRQRQAVFGRIHLYSSSSGTHAPENKSDNVSVENQVTKWKAEASRIRLEAMKMDVTLTLNKIETIERKLGNSAWTQKHPEEQEGLEKKLQALQKKITGEEVDLLLSTVVTTVPELVQTLGDAEKLTDSNDSVLQSVSTLDLSEMRTAQKNKNSRNIRINTAEDPLSGFDEEDLALYVPIVAEIEARMTNSTLDEKLETFQTAPELQDHFKNKIQSMLVQPMEDMQRLEDIKQKYLYSSSSVEKEQIKREIDRLEQTLEKEGPFTYSDSVYKGLPKLTEEQLESRLAAVGGLPPTLQALYKRRTGVDSDGDIRLAVELDHYESQIQLLEQIKYVLPIDEEMRTEVVTSLNSLPASVRDHLAKGIGLDNGNDIDAMIKELSDGDDNSKWGSLQKVVEAATGSPDLPEYNDIEFVDRSRYIDEFYPSIARLERIHPSMEDVDTFLTEVLDKKTFMVNRKPERVVGGYYIRGENIILDDDTGLALVQSLQEKLLSSSLGQKLEFFYLPDPSPPTDEEIDTGYGHSPLILLSTKNRAVLYDGATPMTKGVISALGICSLAIYSLGVCELQPSIHDYVEAALVSGGDKDISFITDIAAMVALSSAAIQVAHETAHRVVAWKDKFEIGLPTPIPSIQLGLLTTITPLRSPPPSIKSLFDFSIAGPLVGLIASLAFLVSGLSMTAAMDMDSAAHLPALPVFLLQSSALGSGLTEFFLGKGVLVSGVTENVVLPLHPFAISGFTGMIANALALLPLGQTDGGRIALAMFGRRGTYIVNTFTTVLLCAAGLFGLDDSRLLLTYVLFSVIWQRELETPARNEVDELDFARGVVGIVSAILVALVLLPTL